MIKSLIFISLFVLLGQTAHAETLKILNSELATKTSYLSSEFDGPIPFWIIDGVLFDLIETKKMVLDHNKIACVSWLMNFSDDKSASKDAIQKQLFQDSNQIPLWKRVTEKPIYMDLESSFAISYVCVGKGANGELVEIELTNIAKMFQGIFLLQ